ncbi:MAG: AI-2E family transporter [Cyanobacteria bacterium P01_F01_bin.150]
MKLSDWIGFLALIIALLILWQFREILLLVFMAVVIAIALNSLVRWLQNRWKLKRSLAVLATLSSVTLMGLLIAALVLPSFVQQLLELEGLIPRGIQQVNDWEETIKNIDVAELPGWVSRFNLDEALQQAQEQAKLPPLGDLIQQMGNILQKVFGDFFGFFSSTAAIALQVLLVVILTIMMLADPTSYRNLLICLFPSFYRRRADAIFTKCEKVLLNWMKGVALSSIFVAIACGMGLSVLGIKLVFANALLAGLFNIIPNIGPTLSVIFPVSVALIPDATLGNAFTPIRSVFSVIVLYLVVQNLESYWFSPMVMRQQVSLLPAATLVAQLFFALFLGPLGLVLALPLTVVSKVWLEEAFVHDILDRWQRPHPLSETGKKQAGQENDGSDGNLELSSGPSAPLSSTSAQKRPEETSRELLPSEKRSEQPSESDQLPLAPDPTLFLPED